MEGRVIEVSGQPLTLSERDEPYYAHRYLRTLRSLGPYTSHCDYPWDDPRPSIFLSELHGDFDHLVSCRTRRRRLGAAIPRHTPEVSLIGAPNSQSETSSLRTLEKLPTNTPAWTLLSFGASMHGRPMILDLSNMLREPLRQWSSH